jgi:hypothetical protein
MQGYPITIDSGSSFAIVERCSFFGHCAAMAEIVSPRFDLESRELGAHSDLEPGGDDAKWW